MSAGSEWSERSMVRQLGPVPERLQAGPVTRAQVVQAFLEHFDGPRYLEIGVSRAVTFDAVTASRKVAVDPAFQFDWRAASEQRGPGADYFEITSDEYFGKVVAQTDMFDVIYLDGLHTFEQTLRDFTNALEHLAPDGVIVIDDVRPSSYHASLPDVAASMRLRAAVGSQSKDWMGDVYKLVWFIDTFFQALSYRTVSNNHGQAVVWRERRGAVTPRSVAEVGSLAWENVELRPEVLRPATLGEIILQYRGTSARSR